MVDFERLNSFAARVLLLLASVAAVCCSGEGPAAGAPDDVRSISLRIACPETRAFAGDGTHHVNRVLILPFRKSAENLLDDNSNYLPAYTYAEQVDVTQFPLGTATLHLPVGTTYKVLIIGYNRSDYDFANPTGPANRFEIGAVSAPVTLANFCLSPKSPTSVPEFFSCLAAAYEGAVSKGTAFRPEQNYTLTGELKRLVSGFSVTVANVPAFVESMTLTADNLVKSSLALDASAQQWQSTGDGGSRTLGRQVPAAGIVTFSCYLLPTFAAHKTGFTLSVSFGSTTQNYTVKAADGAVVSANQFIFNPNEAINLTGDYATIGLGFGIDYGINLDDDQWDGIQ